MTFCIGAFDPGKSGAQSWYFPELDRVSADDLPIVGKDLDAATIAARLRQMRPDVCIIERVASMPHQGVASMFAFGRAFGTIIGVVTALQIPLHFVAPARWKKHFGLDSDKEKSRARALELWPGRSDLFGRKRDHNKAEASLIARFAAETINFNQQQKFAEFSGEPAKTDDASALVIEPENEGL